MSEDKSRKIHKPTPKRIKEFRKKGEVPMSKDMTSVATLAGGVVAIAAFQSTILGSIGDLTRSSMRAAGSGEAGELPAQALRTLLSGVAPVAVGALIGYFIATFVQLGWPMAFKKPSFNLGKVFTYQSIAQIISPKAALGRMLKSSAKVILVLGVVGMAIVGEYQRFLSDPAFTPGALAERHGSAALYLVMLSVLALALLSIIDYILSRRRINEKMMMTTEEIKKEHKESEGDPQLKGRRRQKHQQMASRRTKAAVAEADVILVNPTHYAVALRYDPKKDGAPRLVAKGADELAERIRGFAREAGIPILTRPPLTRLIYRSVAEGREIPPNTYQVVAEILAYVYRIRGRRAS